MPNFLGGSGGKWDPMRTYFEFKMSGGDEGPTHGPGRGCGGQGCLGAGVILVVGFFGGVWVLNSLHVPMVAAVFISLGLLALVGLALIQLSKLIK